MASPSGRNIGIMIGVCAGLAVVAIAFHPVVTTHDRAEQLAQVRSFALADRLVHGTLIAIVGGLLFGLTSFAMRRGLQRAWVLLGLIANGVGTIALVGAALVDGFIVPDIASRSAAGTTATAGQLVVLCAITIQVLTKFGVTAVSAGILAWAVDLMGSRGTLRGSGAVGIVAGGASLCIVMLGGSVSAHSMGAILLLESLWYASIAYLLVRGEV